MVFWRSASSVGAASKRTSSSAVVMCRTCNRVRCFFRQRDGLAGGCQAGVHRTNSGMLARRNSIPKTSPPYRLILLYCRGMLAMCCHKTRGISENTFQHLFIVHQHIPGRSPHKDLHPTGLRSRKRFQFVKVIVRRAEVKNCGSPAKNARHAEISHAAPDGLSWVA